MSVSSDLVGGGWPKATPSTIVVLAVGLWWPQVVLRVPLATNKVMLWVVVTKLVVVPGVQQSACGLGILLIVVVCMIRSRWPLFRARHVHPRWWLSEKVSRHSDLSCVQQTLEKSSNEVFGSSFVTPVCGTWSWACPTTEG